jgi:uncharacterized phage-associated protein
LPHFSLILGFWGKVMIWFLTIRGMARRIVVKVLDLLKAASQLMNAGAFNEKKATQAAAALLNDLPGKQMDFYSFLKLLYIADRISLQETGALVTCDDMIAMDEGPLSDIVYNCIKGEAARCEFWQEHIHKEPEGYALSVKRNPGDSELCDYEVKLLHRVAVEHGSKTWWELRRLTHEFPEYKQNYIQGSSCSIPLRDLLVAVGRGDQAKRIIAETQDRAALSRLFRVHN